MKRYVWLDLNTGTFSNSWDSKDHEMLSKRDVGDAGNKGWKLLEYTCLNDEDFKFYHSMKIVSNTSKNKQK